ncbi:MAG: 50S ribosomal protein L35 [Candidatus Wildermuthbacteria bacterium RIFCSPLOWO2_02_FULL_47_9c]|uniref:Large ribosomal subunit protein bL35 n=2 Tax=Parcubacteria group TaxID=1794811 RepID=A0A837ILZ5_9BACT|nr:MAG: 50S ribosomal protein L35 [Candidatus Yanofskybacteria bacterium GW2011_GWC1_48_11]KKW03979.1 MAG: 50S ribosomal protein L35 [Parcubacteria group bacterium GW2011_GWB1_49_12]KKW08675.1 MAG: 50S ribosomal protein L35 [Parcubacteria group bacterium GW2011_GWA1_49_26]KKW13892.1 MAG: 50S ribosomal protein L35 [Parcubacteria group bacterium GW2011_GWA2_50_10]OHA61625.1 MAG: 50S ribosomal protein L35 [Candidatus Wildermuthbacteria bacterium GWA1_49_26]OHA65343.1 MAG: 50S ribosomal protein L3
MTKQKTKKAITKRFRITPTGKILRRPAGQDHYLAKQSPKKRRRLRKWIELSPAEAKVIRKLLS